MAKNNKFDNSGIGVVLTLATGLITALTPLVTNIVDKNSNEAKNTEEMKPIPNLYTKGFPLTIEQAEVKLKAEGFQMIASKLQMNEADPKFKDCFDYQVIDSDPKSGSKSKPGSVVVVRYITQDAIDRSIQIYNDNLEQIAKEKADKEKKHENQVNKVKQFVGRVKDGIKSTTTIFSKSNTTDR